MYHSTLGLRVIKKKTSPAADATGASASRSITFRERSALPETISSSEAGVRDGDVMKINTPNRNGSRLMYGRDLDKYTNSWLLGYKDLASRRRDRRERVQVDNFQRAIRAPRHHQQLGGGCP